MGWGTRWPRRPVEWRSAAFPGDDAHPPHERAWGPGAPLNTLLQPLRPEEEPAGEDNRLGAYAARLWLPLLRAEQEHHDAGHPRTRTLQPHRPAARGGTTTVLEASAGTGKTFALAGLVTRYIAEGVATLDQMLLITFSRAATQELRDRVRRQIADALKALNDRDPADGNELLVHLLTGNPTNSEPPHQSGRCPGRLRRRHDRHHPPVLQPGPALARGGRRHRRGGGTGGEPRRSGE